MSEIDYFSGDLKRIWQDQIDGTIDLDKGDFLGAMTDLQGDADWQKAFDAIKNESGMQAFLGRMQKHFELCRSPQNPDGSVFAYQDATRTNRTDTNKHPELMIALMKRHLEAVAASLQSQGDVENAERARKVKVVWTTDWESIDDDPYSRDGEPAEISIYGAMSDIEDGREKDGTPAILGEIKEACYGLAASYDLQRYLMQDFYTHGYDLDAFYELEWIYGCGIYFDPQTCYVFDKAARKAAI